MAVLIPQTVTEDRAAGIVIPGALKFNKGRNEYLYKNTGASSSDGNRKTWTLSIWVKRSTTSHGSSGSDKQMFWSHGSGSNGEGFICFDESDQLRFSNDSAGGSSSVTARKCRDVNGWYHIVWAVDTSSAVSNDDRTWIYINGEKLAPADYGSTTISQNAEGYIQRYSDENMDVGIGSRQRGHHGGSNGNYKGSFNGYISHVNFLDGIRVGAEAFGFNDDMTGGIWRPKKYTGSYGTNGYFLPLDGDGPVGKDHSGNGNDFIARGFGTVTLANATGGLPILETMNNGHTCNPGIARTDAHHAHLKLALPLAYDYKDISHLIGSNTSETTMEVGGDAKSDRRQYNYYGTSFVFDGNTGDYVRSANYAAGSDLHFQSGDFTIECWAYRDSGKAGNNPECILTFLSGVSANSDYVWSLRNYNDHWNFYTCTGGNVHHVQDDQYETGFNKWTHLAVCRAGNTYTLYVDGSARKSVTHTNTPNNNANSKLVIGNGHNAGSNDEWGGNIQDLRIYKGVAKYTQDFVVGAVEPDVLPDTPSGISYPIQYKRKTPSTGSVNFDGADDAIRTGDHSDYSLGNGNFTLEFWCWPGYDDSFRTIVSDNLYGSGPASWCCYMNGTEARVAKTNSGFLTSSAEKLIPKMWNHFCWERTGSANVLYVNGKSVATATNGDNFANDRICFGASNFGGDYPTYDYRGYISNFRLVKGSNVYGAAFTPPTSPLTNVTNTKLLCCQSSTDPLAMTVGQSGKPLAYTYGHPSAGEIYSSTGSITGGSSDRADRMFDGRGDSFFSGSSHNGFTTFTFGSGIPFTKLRIAGSNYNGWSAKINGTTFTNWGTTFVNPPWHDVTSSVSSPLTSVSTNSNGSQTATISKIEIDGTVILDGGYGNTNSPQASRFNPFDIDLESYDSPPSSYSTLNSLNSQGGTSSCSDGNLKVTTTTGNDNYGIMTQVPMHTGKYYAEFKSSSWNSASMVGVVYEPYCTKFPTKPCWPGKDSASGNQFSGYGYESKTPRIYMHGSNADNHSQPTHLAGATIDGSVIMAAVDCDTGRCAFGIDGRWNMGTVEESMSQFGERDSNDTTNYYVARRPYYFAFGDSSGSSAVNIDVNFGQKPFKFEPPEGYKPVNMASQDKNKITSPSKYFKTKIYSGTSGNDAQFIDLGFKPDLVWSKDRTDDGVNFCWQDTVMGFDGTDSYYLRTDVNNAWGSGSSTNIKTWDDKGYTIWGNDYLTNASGKNYVSWSWKAGGNNGTFNCDDVGYANAAALKAATGIDMTAGTLTVNKCSINTKAAFSIVEYVGDNSGSQANVSHGIGKKPCFVVIKAKEANSTDWIIGHQNLGEKEQAFKDNKFLKFNSVSSYNNSQVWGLEPTSVVTNVTNGASLGNLNSPSGRKYMMYTWADVPGLQKFGTYAGTGNADGPYVNLGFKPALVILKESTGPWWFVDSVRDTTNPIDGGIQMTTGKEDTGSWTYIDFLSNGFKLRSDHAERNHSGQTYYYAAWADESYNLYGAQPTAR